MAAVEVQEIRAASYVGFDSITQQIEHKLLKRGFQFNVMVVGTCFSVPRFRLGIAGAGRDIDSDRSGLCVSSFGADVRRCWCRQARRDWASRRSSTPSLRRT